MASPISDLVFYVKRSAVDGKAPTLAGIDRGSSLTKAMYLPKNGDEGTTTHYKFHCVLFHNDNFIECLHFLKKNAKLPDKGIIRVTGTGCDRYRGEIREILGLDVEFVHEHLTILLGLHRFVVAVDDPEDLFFPRSLVKSYEIERPEAYQRSQRDLMMQVCKNDGTDPLFPFIYVYSGSGTAFMQINADGSSKRLGRTMVGGKTLLALGSSLAGIDDYDELMDLANKGRTANVDTTVADLLGDEKNSAYGKFALDMPVFPFGKVVDHKRSIDTFDKNDRAASVVRLFACMLFSSVSTAALSLGISKVVFGGHAICGEALRAELYEASDRIFDGALKLRFLRTGGTGAFGAMVLPPIGELNKAESK